MTGAIDVEELKTYFHDLEKDFSFQVKNDPDFPPDMHAVWNSLKRVNKLMKDSKNEEFFSDMILVTSFMHAIQRFEDDDFDEDDDFEYEDDFEDEDEDEDDLDDEDMFDDEDVVLLEKEPKREKTSTKAKANANAKANAKVNANAKINTKANAKS